MEDILKILFALLMIFGPLLYKLFTGSAEEEPKPAAKPRAQPPRQRPPSPVVSAPPRDHEEFMEQLRRRTRQLDTEAEPLEAEIVPEAVPVAALESVSPVLEDDAYYDRHANPHQAVALQDAQVELDHHALHDQALHAANLDALNDHRADLHGGDSAGGRQESTMAAEIAEMMKNSHEIRKAFILGEILQRPASAQRR